MPPRARTTRVRALAGVVALSLGAPMGLAACGGDDGGPGPERTAAGFCATLRTEQQKVSARIRGAGTASPFDRVLGAASSPELVDAIAGFYRALADAAPDEVRSQADDIADVIDGARADIADAAGTPLNVAVGEAFKKAGIRDQVEAVQRYISTNCTATATS